MSIFYIDTHFPWIVTFICLFVLLLLCFSFVFSFISFSSFILSSFLCVLVFYCHFVINSLYVEFDILNFMCFFAICYSMNVQVYNFLRQYACVFLFPYFLKLVLSLLLSLTFTFFYFPCLCVTCLSPIIFYESIMFIKPLFNTTAFLYDKISYKSKMLFLIKIYFFDTVLSLSIIRNKYFHFFDG